MGYIGKLSPTVGNGLGGLPERVSNSKVNSIVYEDKPVSMYRNLMMLSEPYVMVNCKNGFFIGTNTFLILQENTSYNKHSNKTYFMDYRGNITSMPDINTNLTQAALDNNEVQYDYEGNISLVNDSFSMSKNYFNGIENIGIYTNFAGKLVYKISTAPEGYTNAYFKKVNFSDGSYTVAILMGTYDSYFSYYTKDNIQKFSKKLHNNQGQQSIDHSIKIGNKIVHNGVVFDEEGNVIVNRLSYSIVSSYSSSVSTKHGYISSAGFIYDVNKHKQSNTAASYISNTTRYDEKNNVFVKYDPSTIKVFTYDFDTCIYKELSSFTRNSPYYLSSILGVCVVGGYIYALVKTKDSTENKGTNGVLLISFPTLYKGNIDIVKASVRADYFSYSTGLGSSVNQDIGLIYTNLESNPEVNLTSNWTTGAPAGNAFTISNISYEYSNYIVTVDNPSSQIQFKTFEYLNLEQ